MTNTAPVDGTADLRYPIGKYQAPARIEESLRQSWMNEIERLPANVRDAVADLDHPQLDTPYRENGWTVRQLVHHLADSHLNSYGRFRLALTEDKPVIKPYNEAAWAELKDARSAPVEFSLTLLDALHGRWAILLRSMEAGDFARMYRHPELGETTLEQALGLYAWHGRHHVAHIAGLRLRQGW